MTSVSGSFLVVLREDATAQTVLFFLALLAAGLVVAGALYNEDKYIVFSTVPLVLFTIELLHYINNKKKRKRAIYLACCEPCSDQRKMTFCNCECHKKVSS